MKMMSEFREGMWAVVQQAISTLDTDFVSYADERLGNCERLASRPEFENGWPTRPTRSADRQLSERVVDARGPPRGRSHLDVDIGLLVECVELPLDGQELFLRPLHLRAGEPLLAAQRPVQPDGKGSQDDQRTGEVEVVLLEEAWAAYS